MFAIGTNSRSLRLYSLKPIFEDEEDEDTQERKNVELVFEKGNHHFGSIYTVDWSNTGRFIASGSNDKLVKIISVPDFENDVSDEGFSGGYGLMILDNDQVFITLTPKIN